MINCKQNCETFIFTGAGKFKCKFVRPCKEGFTYFPRMNFNVLPQIDTKTKRNLKTKFVLVISVVRDNF